MEVNINARNLVLQSLPKGGTGVEVGVHTGNFSAQILRVAHPRVVYLIDPYKHFEDSKYASAFYGGRAVQGQQTMDERFRGVQKRFKEQIERGQVKLLREFSVEAASNFDDESLDYVYLDGDHTLEGVLADLKAYLPKLKVGGLIIGDDYKLGEWWGEGVVKAFAQCLFEDPIKVEFVVDNQICCRKTAT